MGLQILFFSYPTPVHPPLTCLVKRNVKRERGKYLQRGGEKDCTITATSLTSIVKCYGSEARQD